MDQWVSYLSVASIITGLVSAASWMRASFVKISHEKAMSLRAEQAAARGEKPNFASVSLDGWDMSATFAAQSKWNAAGAFLAACSISLQAIVQALGHV